MVDKITIQFLNTDSMLLVLLYEITKGYAT